MGMWGSQRNRMLVRNLRLLQLLQSRRVTLADLAREVNASERTVRRDISAMEEAHLPLVQDDIGRYGLVARR